MCYLRVKSSPSTHYTTCFPINRVCLPHEHPGGSQKIALIYFTRAERVQPETHPSSTTITHIQQMSLACCGSSVPGNHGMVPPAEGCAASPRRLQRQLPLHGAVSLITPLMSRWKPCYSIWCLSEREGQETLHISDMKCWCTSCKGSGAPLLVWPRRGCQNRLRGCCSPSPGVHQHHKQPQEHPAHRWSSLWVTTGAVLALGGWPSCPPVGSGGFSAGSAGIQH